MSICKWCVAVAVLLGVSQANAEMVPYRIRDLGVVGDSLDSDPYSKGFDLNDAAVVVGTSTTPDLFAERGFSYDTQNGAITDLSTLAGSVENVDSSASGVNSAGDIAGSSETGLGTTHAFSRNSTTGVMQDLGTLGAATLNSNGFDINDAGKVVGSSETSTGLSHAVIWDAAGAIQDLDPGGLISSAQAINNSDQVVGVSLAGGAWTAFLWDDTNGLQGLDKPVDAAASFAYGINDLGDVVGAGVVVPGGETEAVFWGGGGAMQGLGTLGGATSTGWGINDSGWIVGDSLTDSGATHAFYYDADNGMLDLNDILVEADPGWTLITAYAINSDGQITGFGELNGETRAFLLSPIPEPSTYAALISMALVGFFSFWRRSRKAA